MPNLPQKPDGGPVDLGYYNVKVEFRTPKNTLNMQRIGIHAQSAWDALNGVEKLLKHSHNGGTLVEAKVFSVNKETGVVGKYAVLIVGADSTKGVKPNGETEKNPLKPQQKTPATPVHGKQFGEGWARPVASPRPPTHIRLKDTA